MLQIYCFNVGDGDAELLQWKRPGKEDFNILVDSGRIVLDQNPASKRAVATEHLKELHIDHLDAAVITHLHIDHMGGMLDVLRKMPVKKLIVPYIPKGRITAFPEAQEDDPFRIKWSEFCMVCDRWQQTVAYARAHGTVVVTAWEEPVLEEGELRMEQILPHADLGGQMAFFDGFYGEDGPVDRSDWLVPHAWHDFSKQKNAHSLMEWITYKGRRILLAGDRYAATFEDWSYGPCDLIKMPHHGDPRSMTQTLLDRLDPAYAIVSCQLDPRLNKDRPCEPVVRMLQQKGTQLYCTENRQLPSLQPTVSRRICAAIDDDGQMTVEAQA